MSNVVTLKQTKTQAPVEATKFGYDSWRLLIVEALRKHLQKGITMGSVAEDTGLSIHTISRLYYGVTRRPSMETIFALMDYFDYKLFAETIDPLSPKVEIISREMVPTTFGSEPFNMGAQIILDRQMVVDAIRGTAPIPALHDVLRMVGLGKSRVAGATNKWTWAGELAFNRLSDSLLQQIYIHIRKHRIFTKTQMKILASTTGSADLKSHIRSLEAK